MKRWFPWLVYASLAGLLAALWHADYLLAPAIRSWPAALASLVLLGAGFLANAVAWERILEGGGFPVLRREALASFGLSIFAKYIPGKVWMVLGPAAYLGARRGYPLLALSSLGLQLQLLSIWVGLALGGIGLLLVGGDSALVITVAVAWAALGLVLLVPTVHRLGERALGCVLRRAVRLPVLDLAATLRLLPTIVLFWGLWSAGLHLLAVSLLPAPVPMATGLAFPLAGALGILALVAPGGLGVREGILAGYLLLAGLPADQATTLAVVQRGWFVVGEGFAFLAGWWVHRGFGQK